MYYIANYIKPFFLVLNILVVLINANYPQQLCGHTATLINNRIYFVGGGDCPETYPQTSEYFFYLDVSSQFEIYNLLNKMNDLSNYSGLPNLIQAGAVSTGPNKNSILIFGGLMANNMLSGSLYIFDTLNYSRWKPLLINGTTPPGRRNIVPITNSIGNIYIYSGFSGNNGTNTTLEYYNYLDILDTTNGWNWNKGSITNFPTKRDAYTAILIPGDIIVYLGGYCPDCNLTTISLYDTKSNTWEQMNPTGNTPAPRGHATSVTCLDGTGIIVYGGCQITATYQFIRSSPDMLILNISQKPYKWIIPKISGGEHIPPSSLCFHTSTVVGNYMIVAYGFSPSNNQPNSEIFLLDISNNSEFKWVLNFYPGTNNTSISPIPTPIPTPNNNWFII
ncbi:22443_t:CDS:2, partial [Gigaspora margarita]